MSKTAEQIARVVSGWFRKQRSSGRTGPSTAFADELETPLANAYLTGLKESKAGLDAMDRAVSAAKAHAQELAGQLNESTRNMLRDDRPLGEVFGTDRAALIGVEEDNRARQRCTGFAATERGRKLKWVTDGSPCPKICKKLAGKVRKAGKMFAVVNGEPILHPPAHVGCKCRVDEVEA